MAEFVVNSCPKCRAVNLSRVHEDIPGTDSSTPALHCKKCQGIWLPRTAQEKLVSTGTLIENAPAADTSVRDTITGLCPWGHGLLIRAKVVLDSPFYLERCEKCGGIWFDAGEWNRLASSHLLNSLFDLWLPSWQKKQADEQVREKEWRQLADKLGPELTRDVQRVADALTNNPAREEAIAWMFSVIRKGR